VTFDVENGRRRRREGIGERVAKKRGSGWIGGMRGRSESRSVKGEGWGGSCAERNREAKGEGCFAKITARRSVRGKK